MFAHRAQAPPRAARMFFRVCTKSPGCTGEKSAFFRTPDTRKVYFMQGQSSFPLPNRRTDTQKHPHGKAVRVFSRVCPAVGQRKTWLSLYEIHFARARRAKNCRFFAGAARRFCANPKKHAHSPRRCLCPVGKHVIVSLPKNICASVAYMEKG